MVPLGKQVAVNVRAADKSRQYTLHTHTIILSSVRWIFFFFCWCIIGGEQNYEGAAKHLFITCVKNVHLCQTFENTPHKYFQSLVYTATTWAVVAHPHIHEQFLSWWQVCKLESRRVNKQQLERESTHTWKCTQDFKQSSCRSELDCCSSRFVWKVYRVNARQQKMLKFSICAHQHVHFGKALFRDSLIQPLAFDIFTCITAKAANFCTTCVET